MRGCKQNRVRIRSADARVGNLTGHDVVCARRRFVAACALVGAITMVLAVAGALGQAVPQMVRIAEGAGMARSAISGKLADFVSEGDEGFLEAARVAGADVVSASEVPAWFANEVLPASYAAAGAASHDWSVVGFSMPVDIESAFAEVHNSLSERGWIGYGSGMEGMATYTKEDGECSWLMVCCTCVGKETSVVLSVGRRAL